MNSFKTGLCLILFFTILSNLIGQDKSFSPEQQELIDLVKKLNEAEMREDSATIESLQANQYLSIFGNILNLQTANKAQILENSKNLSSKGIQRNRPTSIESYDFKVNLLDHNAVVMTKQTVTLAANGFTLFRQFQLTYFCNKQDGKWKVVASQSIPLHYSSFPKSEQIIFDVLPLPEKVKALTWKKIAEDKQNDALRPNSADGKSLSYFYEKETDIIWFKYELYNTVDTEKPAVSISIDVDTDQKNGTVWYGKNSTFKFDKVLNLGVNQKILETKVIGYNGITSAKGAEIGNWIDEKKNNLMFHFSQSENAYYLGIKRTDISPTAQKINIVGSVGGNSQWSDDIGEGFSTIEF